MRHIDSWRYGRYNISFRKRHMHGDTHTVGSLVVLNSRRSLGLSVVTVLSMSKISELEELPAEDLVNRGSLAVCVTMPAQTE